MSAFSSLHSRHGFWLNLACASACRTPVTSVLRRLGSSGAAAVCMCARVHQLHPGAAKAVLPGAHARPVARGGELCLSCGHARTAAQPGALITPRPATRPNSCFHPHR